MWANLPTPEFGIASHYPPRFEEKAKSRRDRWPWLQVEAGASTSREGLQRQRTIRALATQNMM